MMKVISYILSSIFIITFFSVLIIFHPLQWLGFNLFGYKGHKFIVDLMNLVLMRTTLLLGIHTKFINKYKLEKGQTYIFVANHQSPFDIAPISWYFRKYHPKFVSKKELAKGVPSVSFNLRHGGSVLIDRKNGGSALKDLLVFGKKINEKKWSAVIFPEGTRSRDGDPKTFSANGLKVLSKTNPEAFVVPITINNSWHAFKDGKFPLGLFKTISFIAHEPIKVNSMKFDELLEKTETTIKNHINQTANVKPIQKL
ncbi:MAG: 1-acyl-sn-glycerol-3-phosphate acyltransferase [Planctomycetota bacterium]|jgi:1-acyl-sn-glycerol-3-phosphate acyltransferase